MKQSIEAKIGVMWVGFCPRYLEDGFNDAIPTDSDDSSDEEVTNLWPLLILKSSIYKSLGI